MRVVKMAQKGGENMKGCRLHFLGALLLLLALSSMSCARIFPPAGPPAGLRPAPAVQPPGAIHGLAAQGECLTCHSRDDRFVASLQSNHPVPVPPGFHGSTQEACQLCHTMEQGHAPARAMPHPGEGWEACFACHASAVARAPHIPPNHTAYTLEKCAVCHTPAE